MRPIKEKSNVDHRYPHCNTHGINTKEGAVSFADFGKFIDQYPKLRETADYWMYNLRAHHKNALRAGDVEQFCKGIARGIL